MPRSWKLNNFGHWLTKRLGGRRNTSSSRDRRPKPYTDPRFKQMEQILKELECPVCFNTCTPPIYTCQNGHIICSTCRESITSCPTCRDVNLGTRNFFAEHFIAQYSQSCRFARDGCTFLKWKGEDMKGHERNCFYRPVPCIVPSCSTGVRFKFLLDHMIDAHKVYGTESLPAEVKYHSDDPLIADRRWVPYYIKAFNSNFFLMMEVTRPHFWVWVWVQTPKKDPLNNTVFIAHLMFHNEERNLSLEWKGPVFSIRTPSTMITQDGLCLGGAETLLQHFETDGLIRLKFNIEKKTVAAAATESPGPSKQGQTDDKPATEQDDLLAIKDANANINVNKSVSIAAIGRTSGKTKSSARF